MKKERALKKRVGRPKIDPMHRLATRSWFNYVSNQLEMSAGQLEALFTSFENDKKYRRGNRPKLWEKYRSGIVCPRITGTAAKPSIVEKVDDAVPDASRWLTSPFWRLLSSKPMNMDEIRGVFLSLKPEIRDLFVIEGYKDSNVFWRKPSDIKPLVRLLLSGALPRRRSDWAILEASTTIFALLREAEVKQDQLQHIDVLTAWLEYPDFLKSEPSFHNIEHEISQAITKRLLSVRYFQDGLQLKWQFHKTGKLELITC